MHVGAIVCGILGVIFGLIPLTFFLAWTLGLIAVVLGIMAYRRAKRVGQHQGRAGLVLGVIAIALGGLGLAIVSDAFEDLDDDLTCLDEADTPEEIDACNEESGSDEPRPEPATGSGDALACLDQAETLEEIDACGPEAVDEWNRRVDEWNACLERNGGTDDGCVHPGGRQGQATDTPAGRNEVEGMGSGQEQHEWGCEQGYISEDC
jgi:hypothetical protein